MVATAKVNRAGIRRNDPQELRHLRQPFDDDRQDAHIPHCLIG
jgi:hypothetical protein